MNVWLLALVFIVPTGAGSVAALFTLIRDRRRMTVAFAKGRAETVRLPMPVEPMPTLPLEAA